MNKKERIKLIKIGLLQKNITFADIAEVFNCSKQSIERIARGHSKGIKLSNKIIMELFAEIAGYSYEKIWGSD